MLVLSRRIGETIMIGDEIEISIIEIQGDKVKIGISAPKNVRILRKELIEEVKSTNTQAAEVNVSLGDLAEAFASKGRKC